jgi:1,4-alpha-glucan branching enzyme
MASELLDEGAARALAEGRHGDPFAVLGPHRVKGGTLITVFLPGADRIWVRTGSREAEANAYPGVPGLFTYLQPRRAAYRLRAEGSGLTWEFDDPFASARCWARWTNISWARARIAGSGRCWARIASRMKVRRGCISRSGPRMPSASRSLAISTSGTVGRHPMRRRGPTGVWEIFVPGLAEGEVYKYEIRGPQGELLPLKADPVGFGSEHPPANASVVRRIGGSFADADWMQTRAARNGVGAPISVYEVHLGSWKRAPGDRMLSYIELAEQLVGYAVDMGFTHLELLPVSGISVRRQLGLSAHRPVRANHPSRHAIGIPRLRRCCAPGGAGGDP